MITRLQRFFLSNPSVVSKWLMGEFIDLGNGLSVKGEFTLNQSREGRIYQNVDFTFMMEGIEVGSIDQELGGFICPPHLREEWDLCRKMGIDIDPKKEDDLFEFMGKCGDEITKLFPDLYEDRDFIYEQEDIG